MTYQNIMIDRIKEMIHQLDCIDCPMFKSCYDNIQSPDECKELIEWLNEQYI